MKNTFKTNPTPSVFKRTAGLLLAVLVALVACGGKRSASGTPKAAAPVRPDTRRLVAPIRIRVLIQENFSRLLIEDAETSPTIRIRVKGGQIELEERDRRRLATGFLIRPERSGLLKVQRRPYRGDFEVFINPLGKAVLVNIVELEDYLRSVVPNELGPATHPYLEALKAQAVAARTYAVAGLGHFDHLGFDLYGDFRSQAYTGSAAEHPLSDRAVLDTRGRVAMHQGRPIIAMYSSTCGGITASYKEMFNASEIPYLHGGVKCHDEHSPYHQWEESFLISNVQNEVDNYAGVGRLKKVRPLRRDRAGRVLEMSFEGANTSKSLKGVNLRFALGLRSNWLTKLEPSRDAEGFIRSLRVKGRGWGHGVGLCQYGAVEMAQSGAGYQKILKHYYPGVEIVRGP